MINNRITALMTIVAAACLLFTPFENEARGGRGGGGGRGVSNARGASYRGGQAMNRTPTMSRAASRPSPARQQITAKPSVSQGRIQQPRQALQQRPSSVNRSELRNQVSQFAQSQNIPSQNIDRQGLSQQVQNFSNTRSSQISQNGQLSDKVSQRLQQVQPNSDRWFNQDFFDTHNVGTDYAAVGNNWWRPAAWATLATWGAWNWSTPYYYDDGGYAYPITVDSSTYAYPYETTPTTTQTESAQNTQTTASTSDEWQPLGVFAVASSPEAAAQSTRFIQLAINRKGEIDGVLYNSTTDIAQDITGMVDPKNQKAYWSLEYRTDSPIASTGLYNLTEDQTPINVHFPDGSDQTWTLVRLRNKK